MIGLLLLLLLPQQAWAKRVALVVGNAAYAERPLANPVNDARLMQTTLRSLGFEVQIVTNADRRGLLSSLREFEGRAREAEVAVFYFAGHGAQVGGANYLIPVNAPIRSDSDLPDEAVDAASVLRRLEEARARVALVILDACRDNPYPGSQRSASRGLARMNAPTGTIVAYATAPGSTAEDGAGTNGTYTAALARHLATPGLDIKEVFDQTAQEVERVTNGRQRPREDVGLRGRFVLREVVAQVGPVSAPAPAVAAPAAPSAAAGPSAAEREDRFWDSALKIGNRDAYEAYLSEYPKGRYAALARAAIARLGQAGVVAAAPAPVVAAAPSALAPRPAPAAAAPPPSPPARAGLGAPGTVFKDCEVCPEMVVIPGGSFLMGSPLGAGDDDERPQRRVTIAPFALGRTEVTQAQWFAVMGTRPSRFKGDNLPVDLVSWNDAQEFVQRLSSMTDRRYRLPSEAEWEYAARAGSQGAYSFGDDEKQLGQYAWYGGIFTKPGRSQPVGHKQANAFGLYDMHGNVWEWVEDCWNGSYVGAPADGRAWTSGECGRRVLRGGSWHSFPRNMRAAYRFGNDMSIRDVVYGLRVARTD